MSDDFDGITIISQTTAERKDETKELFLQVKPYLEKGLSLGKSVKMVKPDLSSNYFGQGWYRELRDYTDEQGYRGRY